jgi:hypothetical protein
LLRRKFGDKFNEIMRMAKRKRGKGREIKKEKAKESEE